MATTLLVLAGFAALFTIFGLFAGRRSCTGRCPGCPGTACRWEADDE